VQDQSYVYRSVTQPAKVRESALQQMVKTFFDGSAASAATALLGLSKAIKPEELDALQRAIDEAKERQS
jgi:predicted transcriptional regulator